MRRSILFILIFVCYITPAVCRQSTLPLTLEEARQLFAEKNLQLLAAHYDIDLAQAEIDQARLFENPVISVDHNIYNKLSKRYFDFGSEGQTEVEIEQMIRIAGQRNKEIRVSKINKEIARYEWEELCRTLQGELNESFIKLYYTSQSINVLDREIASVARLLEVYRAQAERGDISRLEKSRLEALLLTLKQEQKEWNDEWLELQSTLRLFLALPVQVNVEAQLDEKSMLAIDPESLPLQTLFGGLQERPDLRIALADIRLAEADLRLQKSQAWPEFSLRGMYDRAGGIYDNYFALGVTLSVPVFNRNQGNIKAARLTIKQNSLKEQYAREEANNELYIAYNKLKKNLELYQSTDSNLAEELSQLLEGVESNFLKKNISLLEFIDYYEAYKEASIQLYQLRQDLLLSWNEFRTVANLKE